MNIYEKLSLGIGVAVFLICFFAILFNNEMWAIIGTISLISLWLINKIQNIINRLL